MLMNGICEFLIKKKFLKDFSKMWFHTVDRMPLLSTEILKRIVKYFTCAYTLYSSLQTRYFLIFL